MRLMEMNVRGLGRLGRRWWWERVQMQLGHLRSMFLWNTSSEDVNRANSTQASAGLLDYYSSVVFIGFKDVN